MENEILREPQYATFQTPGHLRPKPRDEHEWSEYLDGFSTLNSHQRVNHKDHPVELCWDMFEIPILLILIAIMSAFSAYFSSMFVNYGNTFRWSLVSTTDNADNWILYCLWCLLFALLASFLTQTICKEASGSGLPEMKTILSGVIKPVLLSVRLIIAKMTGLSLALIAGLSVGKEGPFVQIAGAIADQLMTLPAFRHVRRQDTKRLEVIACACASGVCVTFGTAFGGVLFSIEFTSSAYLVKTLPKAFLTAACAMIVIFWLGVTEKLELFDQEIQTKNLQPKGVELAAFVAIGVVSGVLGVIFVSIVEFISSLRNRWLDTTKYSRSVVRYRSYFMVGIVSLLTSIPMYYELATFPFVHEESSNTFHLIGSNTTFVFMNSSYSGDSNGTSSFASYNYDRGLSSKTLMDVLFQKSDFTNVTSYLLPYFIYKFIATAVSVTLPLPVGLFTPVFLTGGILGRIIGEKLCESPSFVNYAPWEYSLLAAAGLATGVTRAISTAVIVYELAGKSHLRLPLSVVVLTAYFVGNRFSKNVYDALIDTNGTPYMQELPKSLYNVPVSHVMIPINQSHVLALNSTYKEAYKLLKAMNALHGLIKVNGRRSIDMTSQENDLTAAYHQELMDYITTKNSLHVEMPHMDKTIPHSIKHYSPTVIPIVKSKKSMVIVGAILKEDLEASVKRLVKMIQVTKRPPIILGRYSSTDLSDNSNDYGRPVIPEARSSDEEDSQGDKSHSEEQRGTLSPIKSSNLTVQPSSGSSSNHTPFTTEVQYDSQDYYQYQSNSDPIVSAKNQKKRKMSEAEPTVNRRIEFNHQTGNSSVIENQTTLSPQILPSDGETDAEEDVDQLMLNDTYMNEKLQFILISHGGRKITPVALSPEAHDQSTSWKTLALAVPIDPSPYQIVDSMLLNKVELIFRMLSLNQAYVTNSGKLVGIINRATLREFLGKYSKRPIDKCLLLMQSISSCLLCGWNDALSESVSSPRSRGYSTVPDLEAAY